MTAIHDFIVKGTLRNHVEAAITRYEEFTAIDDYMQHSNKKWFYEATVQGFIYSQLAFKYDTGYKESNEYLVFLEEPYSSTSTENRADILFVSTDTDMSRKYSSAIELKTDFNYDSVLSDARVLARYIHEGNLSTGYVIFFAESDEIIDDWISKLKADRELKPLFTGKQLFGVGMVGSPQ